MTYRAKYKAVIEINSLIEAVWELAWEHGTLCDKDILAKLYAVNHELIIVRRIIFTNIGWRNFTDYATDS